MKKTFILALILIVLINIFTLTSCVEDDKDIDSETNTTVDNDKDTSKDDKEEHIHEFSNEWSKIDEYHFHECLGKDCFEVADKQEHLWDEGKITTEATKEEMGEKIYTCTVCNAVKGEKLEFNGISKEKWNSIVDLAAFDNVTFQSVANITKQPNDTDITVVKIDNNKYLIDDEKAEEEDIRNIQELFIKTSLAIVSNFENYDYDKEKDQYVSNTTIIYSVNMIVDDTIATTATITVNDAIIKLDNEMRLYKIKCHMIQEFIVDGYEKVFDFVPTFTFTDYGTTVIE